MMRAQVRDIWPSSYRASASAAGTGLSVWIVRDTRSCHSTGATVEARRREIAVRARLQVEALAHDVAART